MQDDGNAKEKVLYNLTTQNPLRSCDIITLSTIWRTDPTARQAEAKSSCVHKQRYNLSILKPKASVQNIRMKESWRRRVIWWRTYRMEIDRVIFIGKRLQFFFGHILCGSHQLDVLFPVQTQQICVLSDFYCSMHCKTRMKSVCMNVNVHLRMNE